MAKSMLFSALILSTTLTALSCQSPADTAQSDTSVTGPSENSAMIQETINDEMVPDSNIIYETPESDETNAPASGNHPGSAGASEHMKTLSDAAVDNTEADTIRDVAGNNGTPAISPHYFVLQIGAYKNADNAKEILEKLKAIQLSAHIDREDDFSKVRIAGIRTKEEVESIIREVNAQFRLAPVLLKDMSE